MMYPATTRMNRRGWVKTRVNRIHADSKASERVPLLKGHVKDRNGVGARRSQNSQKD